MSKPKGSKKLTAKEQAYRNARVAGENQTQSAKAAGYKHPNKVASRLDKKPAIADVVEARQEKALERAEVTAEMVLTELWRVAGLDLRMAYNPDGTLKSIHQMPEDVARAMAGVDVDELFEGVGRDREQVGVTKKVRFWDKVRALELLGKRLKLWADTGELSGLGGGPIIFQMVPANYDAAPNSPDQNNKGL